MSTYEELMLVIGVAMLIVAILNLNRWSNPLPLSRGGVGRGKRGLLHQWGSKPPLMNCEAVAVHEHEAERNANVRFYEISKAALLLGRCRRLYLM